MDTPSHTALGREILSTVRSDLYLSLRFLDAALSGLTFEMSPLIPSSATDGERLYFQPHYLFRSYDENPVLVNRAFLHNLLHCLFSHLYLEPARNRELWDLCCDICTESILDSLDVPCLRKIPSSLREETYRFIQDNQITLLTPGRLCRLFEGSVFYQRNMLLLEQEFCIDSHVFWPGSREDGPQKQEQQKRLQEKWQELGDKTRTSMETFERRAGTEAGSLLRTLKLSRGNPMKYDGFLRRFAAWQDCLRINDEEFDTAYYTLGMDLYGSIPLIEPLEYKEEKKIRSLVIAIDTSGSVRGTPVRRFLSETMAILGNSKRFFTHMKIRLLQFDTVIQEELLITSFDEFAAQADAFAIRGGGGTDYRCVFRYLESLRESRVQEAVQGVMILTDGYGTFPAAPPACPAAFLLADFLKEDGGSAREPAFDSVPDWAIRLRIDEPEAIIGKELSIT